MQCEDHVVGAALPWVAFIDVDDHATAATVLRARAGKRLVKTFPTRRIAQHRSRSGACLFATLCFLILAETPPPPWPLLALEKGKGEFDIAVPLPSHGKA